MTDEMGVECLDRHWWPCGPLKARQSKGVYTAYGQDYSETLSPIVNMSFVCFFLVMKHSWADIENCSVN